MMSLDQGRIFESHVLHDLCAAFGVKKSHTTPYHPMGDGLVERMNRSLLNLLRVFTDSRHDWEEHLQLLLFFYRTPRHSSTGLSPYEVLFGNNPPLLHLPFIHTSIIPDPSAYSVCLQQKLLELREMVEVNFIEVVDRQRQTYGGSSDKQLSVGQHVLLSNPTGGKLDPRWRSPWTITKLRGLTIITITMGKIEQTVSCWRPHQHPLQTPESTCQLVSFFAHQEEIESSPVTLSAPQATLPAPVTKWSGRLVKPVDCYGDHVTH